MLHVRKCSEGCFKENRSVAICLPDQLIECLKFVAEYILSMVINFADWLYSGNSAYTSSMLGLSVSVNAFPVKN